MLQGYETDVTFVLKLVLQAEREDIILPIFFIAFHEVALFIEVEFVISLYADMFVETVKSSDTQGALGKVCFGGETVFYTDLVSFQLGVGVIGVIFQYGREGRCSDVLYELEEIADEGTFEQRVLWQVLGACPGVRAFATAGDAGLCP